MFTAREYTILNPVNMRPYRYVDTILRSTFKYLYFVEAGQWDQNIDIRVLSVFLLFPYITCLKLICCYRVIVEFDYYWDKKASISDAKKSNRSMTK